MMCRVYSWIMVTAVFFASGCVAAGGNISIPETVTIPAGAFIAGSDRREREYAYKLDEAAYGHSRTREWKWYESEFPRQKKKLPAFQIARSLITNRHYAAFVRATGHRHPEVDRKTWKSYGLIHPYPRTRRHAWKDGSPPPSRENHPVVLVSHGDARAYARWISAETGAHYRLPTEWELEKAMRGTDGRRFPWGDEFDATLLNSHDAGSFDTIPVGRFPKGNSPFGLTDAAEQVFEWTATEGNKNRYIVKGGSWDDSGCGICRPAARHSRPAELEHILIGFRLVREE